MYICICICICICKPIEKEIINKKFYGTGKLMGKTNAEILDMKNATKPLKDLLLSCLSNLNNNHNMYIYVCMYMYMYMYETNRKINNKQTDLQ